MAASNITLCTNGGGMLHTRLKVALQVAKRIDAEIDVLTFRTAQVPSMLGRGFVEASHEAMKMAWDRENVSIADARKTYDACLRAYHADAAKVRWVEAFEDVAVAFPSYARACDIVVAGGRSDDPSSSTLGDAVSKISLLESGRLALFVAEPSPETADPLAKVLIAWDDRPAAARAIAQAMPLIGAAAAVRLFIVEASPGQTTPCNQILAYLRRHAPSVEVQVAEPLFRTVGHTITKGAEDWGASMIIMGSYEHSRAREILLGGATRFVIDNAGCPVAMTN